MDLERSFGWMMLALSLLFLKEEKKEEEKVEVVLGFVDEIR